MLGSGSEVSAAVACLVVREEWRGRPGEVVADAAAPALVRAAAALSAGEPRRALRLIDEADADEPALADALRALAHVLDRNWFPGGAGAVLEDADLAELDVPELAVPAGDAAVPVFLAGRLLAMTPNWRSLARGGVTLGPVADIALGSAHEELETALRLGESHAVGIAALVLADLSIRAGRITTAGQPLGLAMQAYTAAGDPIGLGACELARGDWSAEPASHPELLGEDLEGTSSQSPEVFEADPAFAAERYSVAAERFAAGDGARGLAALELRRAALAVRTGDLDAALEHLDSARAGAMHAGDGALLALATVHRDLVALERDGRVDAAVSGRQVGQWAMSDGSRSFARGLARLCAARARRWRESDRLARARGALAIADAINAGIGAVSEPALIRRELVALYGGSNYRRASLVLTLLDLGEREAAAKEPLDDTRWAALVDRAISARSDATALADPDGLVEVGAHLTWLLERAPASGDGVGPPLRAVLEQTVAEDRVLVPLYRGTVARADGRTEEADALFGEALAIARSLGAAGGLLPAVVLGTMGCFEEALGIVEPLAAAGALAPDLAALLYIRLRRYDRALEALAALDALGGAGPSDRPWEASARRAAALLGVGDAPAARGHADEAVAAFEAHLARLSSDVLRTMAGDDVSVSDLYTTGVRAHVAIEGEAAQAFELSDRVRGAQLTDLLDLDRDAGAEPAVVEAVRRWQRGGAELARTIEHVAEQAARVSSGTAVRQQIVGAERELDDAEAQLERVAPALLAGRRRLPLTPALEDVQAQLGPATLLVQYHVGDDELLTWAVTRDGRRVSRVAVRDSRLDSQVSRFHRACSDATSTEAARAALAEPLRELLLAPLEPELADCAHVIFVPHRRLAMLPFGALEHDGDALIAERTVASLPAASVLVRRPLGPPPARDGAALVLGDPATGGDRGLARLPGAATEAAAVAALHRVTPLPSDEADRAAVLTRLASARIAHLATHGYLYEGRPFSAELALTG